MKRILVAVFLVAGLVGQAALAQTMYVSDELVITFRTGPSADNAITQNLSSGDRVEVLEELADEGYSRVRLDDGEEGWVLSRYLQPGMTAELQLEAANRNLSQAQSELAALESENARLADELATTRQALAESRAEAGQSETELNRIRAISADAISVDEQNDSLRRRVTELTSANDLAQMEIGELRSRNRQTWFIVGAAVLFGGIVIGLVAPSLRRKRRSSW